MNDFSYDILDLLKKYDNDVNAALAGENCPQCLYAFSPLRENLVEWVEFEPDARVLQIGSDYGSFTGILAERAGEVVVLDPRDENLEVNRIRHGERSNVTYVRGDLRDQVQWKKNELAKLKAESDGNSAIGIAGRNAELFKVYKSKSGTEASDIKDIMFRPFDYIVLGGFLMECKKEEAAELLREAADYLKTGGVMLAAVENETGVRYWMGAPKQENSYLEPEFRSLFEELTTTWGGSFTMYYPVPDYRYPVAVYSDHYLPETGDVTNISARYDGPGFWFGSEEEAMAKACQNGMFTKFNNSFLGVWEKGTK
ncbi:MAG: methyltransferase domain-containing protein [Lachnospiraceae bacterium]|nr:methyltransferase domain-containing protein [Lachnospiraceae bacterium]MBQ6856709.1 methyltransferase domain-containing protein [Lachnospiraceae bacterium]